MGQFCDFFVGNMPSRLLCWGAQGIVNTLLYLMTDLVLKLAGNLEGSHYCDAGVVGELEAVVSTQY